MFVKPQRTILKHFRHCLTYKRLKTPIGVQFYSSNDCRRKFFVGGNMKMNGSKEMICGMADMFSKEYFGDEVDVVIAPPSPYLEFAKQRMPCGIYIAGQNCYKEMHGAFTGEISPTMVSEMGASWIILGHSERRTIFKESDDDIAEKIKKCLDCELNVIACLGENLEERESGKTSKVVVRQLKAIISRVTDWTKVVIAYEPVWAIGTGKVATPDQAQEVHCNIRYYIKTNVSPSASKIARIIYGGSVTGDNAEQLAKESDIDGFLVGGASLKPEFVKIIHANKVKLT